MGWGKNASSGAENVNFYYINKLYYEAIQPVENDKHIPTVIRNFNTVYVLINFTQFQKFLVIHLFLYL